MAIAAIRPHRLCLFVVLALIVPADGHREAESDDEAEKCQGSGLDDAELLKRAP